MKKSFSILLSFVLIAGMSLVFFTPLQMLAVEQEDAPVSITVNGNAVDEVTLENLEDVVFNVSVSQNTDVDNKLIIKLPIGLELVSAPGIEQVDFNGNVTSKDYTSDEDNSLKSNPVWEGIEPIQGVGTKSGTLTYEFKRVSGPSVQFSVRVNPNFVPIAKDTLSSLLGEVTAELQNVDNTIISDAAVKIQVKSQARDLELTYFNNVENFNTDSFTNVALNGSQANKYLADDRTSVHFISFKANVNPAIDNASYPMPIKEHSFKLTYPTGATFSFQQKPLYEQVGDVVDNLDGTSTITVSSTYDFNLINGNPISCGFAYIDFSNVYNEMTPAGTQYNVTISDLSITTRSFDPNTSEFKEVIISNVGDSSQVNKQITATYVGNMDSSLYDPYFDFESGNTEEYNEFTHQSLPLYTARRVLNTSNKPGLNNTENGSGLPVKMEYIAIPDTNSYLDNVTSVSMDVPFLGKEGNSCYSSQLKSITVWYESDDTGSIGITDEIGHELDIAAFQQSTLAGNLEKDSSNMLSSAYNKVNTDIQNGTAIYHWKKSSKTPCIAITAPNGESIVKISMEFTGDNDTLWEKHSVFAKSQVNGYPKNDEYTGIYSKYQFSIAQQDATDVSKWVEKATSEIGGFRWKEPETFTMSYEDTSLKNKYYYYNVAKYNTQIQLNNSTYMIEGYQNLGSINVFNDTGAPTEEGSYLVLGFEKDLNSKDVIKKVQLPLCPIEGEEGIVSIEYTYENGSTHIYHANSAEAAPYTINSNGELIMEASGDHKYQSVKVTLNSWGRANDKVKFAIYGYLSDSSELVAEDKHKLSCTVYDQDDVEESEEGFETNVNSTFAEYKNTGADLVISGMVNSSISDSETKPANVLNAGSTKNIEIKLVGGNYNHITNGAWTDITFNIVLPEGVTLIGLNGRDFALEAKGSVSTTYTTKETVGNISYTTRKMSEAEAKAHFGENVTGGTIYTCTVDDPDVVLYGYRNNSYDDKAFATFKIDANIHVAADAQAMAIPWSKSIFLGSNANYSEFIRLGSDKGNDKYLVGKGQEVDNFEVGNALRLGMTDSLIAGSSDEYLLITNDPQLMVNDARVEVGGKYYHYSSTNPETLATLGRNDLGTMHFTVTNTVNSKVDSNTNYVVIALPTTSNSLSNENDFTTLIKDVRIDGTTLTGSPITGNGMTITAKYLSLADNDVTANSVNDLFNNASVNFVNHDALILKIEDQDYLNSFDVSVDFQMPNTETEKDNIQYVELEAQAIYYLNASNQASYNSKEDGNSYIRFAYENPKYDINFKGFSVDKDGIIGKELVLDMPTENIFTNTDIYDVETDNNGDIIITAPTISGYNFKGWYADEDLIDLFFEDNKATITDDTTLYAKYEEKEIIVIFVNNNGEADIVKTFNYTDVISGIGAPIKPEYAFVEWCTDFELKNPLTAATYGELDTDDDGKVILYASYVQKLFTVSYDIDGFIDNNKYEEGDKVTLLSNQPTKEGYSFVGWEYDGNVYNSAKPYIMGNENALFKAKWDINKYEVSFDENGGNAVSGDGLYEFGSSIQLPTSTKVGNKFDHWIDDKGNEYAGGSDYVIPSEATQFTAKWSDKAYIVKFIDAESKHVYDTINVNYKDVATLPTVSKTGYTFSHWVYDGNKYTTTNFDVPDEIDGTEFIFEAHFDINEYSITFDTTDVINASMFGEIKQDYNSVVKLPTVLPSKKGHMFVAWEDDNNNRYDAGAEFKMPIDGMNLKPVWQINKYTVTFANTGDYAIGTVEVPFGEKYTIPNPVKNGYNFVHWIDQYGNLYTAEQVIEMEDANITLTGVWSAITNPPTLEPTTPDVTNPPTTESPDTGYNSSVMLWVILAIVSALNIQITRRRLMR